jgi:hypothetical protein
MTHKLSSNRGGGMVSMTGISNMTYGAAYLGVKRDAATTRRKRRRAAPRLRRQKRVTSLAIDAALKALGAFYRTALVLTGSKRYETTAVGVYYMNGGCLSGA